MLEIKNLNVYINDKQIIDSLSFAVQRHDKLAIIGEEGNGKSTLIKILAGNFDYGEYTGAIKISGKIGYLEQHIHQKYFDYKVFDYIFNTKEDYYNKISEYYNLLSELGLTDDIEGKNISSLSGGEKVKVQILKILLDEADILLLDEPSNDIDINALKWLENFIKNIDKPVLFVSHDELLLENCATRVLLLEMLNKKTLPSYRLETLKYESFVENRKNTLEKDTMIAKKERANLNKQMQRLNQIKNKVDHQQNTITRADPHGGKLLKKKMKSILSMEKRILGNTLTEIPDYEDEINIFFNDVNIPSKKILISYENEKIGTHNYVLINNLNLIITGNEHIVITGNNGTGKTTLLKKIYNDLKDRTDISAGYMPQNYDEVLDNNLTPVDYICNNSDKDEISLVRSYLGNLKFTKEEMTSKIESLSGGSKAKLILMKLIYNNNNVLVLDEPTRNVSPLSNPVIRKALKEYKGAIISVSHDRKYIADTDTIYEILNKELIKK